MSTGDPAGLVTRRTITRSSSTSRAGEPTITARSPLQLFWRRLRRDRVAMAALGFIVLLILVAIFAPLIVAILGAPDPKQQNSSALDLFGGPTGPTADHWFGVDQLGRDIFSRTIYGARVSLEVALIATGLAVRHRHRRRPGGRLLPRLGRHDPLAPDRRRPRLPDPAAGPRPRGGLLGRRRLPRRHDPAGAPGRDHGDRDHQLDLHRADRARPGPVPAREGVRRGGALAGRVELADHHAGDPPQPRRAADRLLVAADPGQHPARGGAVVPRRGCVAAAPPRGAR